METFRRPVSRYYAKAPSRVAEEYLPEEENEIVEKSNGHISPSFIIGAKTVAGIGLGLVTVVAGAAVIGLAAETVLVPSLLLKLAGGLAGGGVGMAKGLQDAGKRN